MGCPPMHKTRVRLPRAAEYACSLLPFTPARGLLSLRPFPPFGRRMCWFQTPLAFPADGAVCDTPALLVAHLALTAGPGWHRSCLSRRVLLVRPIRLASAGGLASGKRARQRLWVRACILLPPQPWEPHPPTVGVRFRQVVSRAHIALYTRLSALLWLQHVLRHPCTRVILLASFWRPQP